MPPIKKKKVETVEETTDAVVETVTVNDDIYERVKGIVPRKEPKNYVSTGITLLNLALSNNKDAGYERGQIVHITGNKHAGKTFFGQTFLASACYDKNTKNDKKFFVNAERSDNFDHDLLYGHAYNEQVSDVFKDDDIYLLESFYDKADALCDGKEPILMTVDSFTSLVSELQLELSEKNADLREKGKETKSDYVSMKKGNVNSDRLAILSQKLAKNKGIILFLTQVRSNADATGPYAPKYKETTGGNALPHYEHYGFSLTVKKSITVMDFKKQEQKIGNIVEISITKNKATGVQCKLEVPVYTEYGIDDLGANLNYLYTYGVVHGKNLGSLVSPYSPKGEDGEYVKMNMKELASHIEANNLEEAVRTDVEKVWLESRLSISLGRKKRFGC